MNIFPTRFQHPDFVAECTEHLTTLSIRAVDGVVMQDVPWRHLIQRGLANVSHFHVQSSARTLMWNGEEDLTRNWIQACNDQKKAYPILAWAETRYLQGKKALAWEQFKKYENPCCNFQYNLVDILMVFDRTDDFYRFLQQSEDQADKVRRKIPLALIHHQLLGNTEKANDLFEECLRVKSLTIRDRCMLVNFLRLTHQHSDFARQLLNEDPDAETPTADAIRLAYCWKELFMENDLSKKWLRLASDRSKTFPEMYRCSVGWIALHRDKQQAFHYQRKTADLAKDLKEKKDSALLEADILSALGEKCSVECRQDLRDRQD